MGEFRRHFLKASFHTRWVEVTKEQWLAAERSAGFQPEPGYGEYATAGFGTDNISGRYTDDGTKP